MMKTNTLGEKIGYEKEYQPLSVIELSHLLDEFRKNKKSYNVTSTGHNWGYGCYASHKDSSNHISLQKLNRIIDFDRENGLITLQPGVTYKHVQKFLKQNAPEWITPVHGGGPDCSVIGNALERGYGITPIMDHFSACYSLKAILPDGRLYESPLGSINLKSMAKKFRYGIGPYLDGIFTQSNFGIVTEMTIKLASKSEAIELFFINIEEKELSKAVNAIKKIKSRYKGIVGGVNLMNKERVLSMMIDYPTEDIENREPLSKDLIDKYAKELMIGDWNIVGAIFGPRKIVKSCKKLIKEDIKSISGKKIFLSQRKINFLKNLSEVIAPIFPSGLKKTVKTLTELLDILNGIPQKTALKLAYWKNLSNKNFDNPTNDNCGLIWYAPLVELNSKNVREYVNFLNETSKKHNFNPIITLTTVDELCFDSTIPIIFNKDDPKDMERAHNYFNDLLESGHKKGFYPYRFGTNSMESYLSKLPSDTLSILESIKTAFDPENLYAQGRYQKKISKSNESSIRQKTNILKSV